MKNKCPSSQDFKENEEQMDDEDSHAADNYGRQSKEDSQRSKINGNAIFHSIFRIQKRSKG